MALLAFMDDFPSWSECLEAFAYPPSWIAGLLAGLLMRRWFVAFAVAAILATIGDIALTFAFSDAQPRVHWAELVVFGVTAGITAMIVFVTRVALRKQRQRPAKR